jgi:hypothetical protein
LQRREEVEGPLEKTTSPRGPPDFKTSLSKKERKKEPKLLFPSFSSSLLFGVYNQQ